MSSPRYDLATVAVYDPVAMNRNATRNVLYSLGFREIDSFASMDDMRRAISTRDFDLIVAEVPPGEKQVCEFVAGVRRSTIGTNPFTVVVLTTFVAEGQTVRAMLDSGADDVLTRPFSTNVLGERIRTLVEGRKNFVVTSDYVGPDRRKDAGRDSNARLIPVVNSLRLKAVDGLSGVEAHQAMLASVADSRRTVNLERMRRAAFQIGVIAGFVRAQAEGRADDTPIRKSDLERIVASAQELSALAKQERADQAVKTCQTVIDVAQKALRGESIQSNAQILVRLSVALQVTLTPGRDETDLHNELDETLERIRGRGRRA